MKPSPGSAYTRTNTGTSRLYIVGGKGVLSLSRFESRKDYWELGTFSKFY
jgi:hypothetical protein